MMPIDPKDFKAPFFKPDYIWEQADNFRQNYSPNSLPVDILSIVEFDLEMKIIPIKNLREDCDTEAALYGDIGKIAVDYDSYMDERYISRLRFSVAHEIGHRILHANVYSEVAHTTIEEWIQFYSSIPDREYSYLEYHANEFAGRLLVPHPTLLKLTEREIEKALSSGVNNMDPAKEYIANRIARSFGVSQDVIMHRFAKEGVWTKVLEKNNKL